MAKHLTPDGVAARLKSDCAVSQAKHLRKDATPTEKKLWYELRGIRPLRFRRQVPFGPYIVDFACHGARLIIELDGEVHDRLGAGDAEREAWLEGRGYRVLRFKNGDIRTNIALVMQQILAAC